MKNDSPGLPRSRCHIQRSRPQRRAFVVPILLCVGTVVVQSACQSYERQPLDTNGLRNTLQLASRLAIALIRYEAGKSQRTLVESSVVPLADEQEADVRRVAELGRVDPLLLLESLKTLHAAKLRLIDARATEAIGAIRVDELIGPPVPPPLPMPTGNTPSPAADSFAPVEGH